MEQNNNNISELMIATLKKENLSFAQDLLEISVDSVLEDGVIKDIPILRSIVGVCKTIGNISDILFTRKLATFLVGLNDSNAQQRQMAIDKWIKDSKYRIRVGESLINMINRCDDTQKSKWLSKLFYELVLIKQWSDLFMRAEKVLSSLSVMDVMRFLNLPKDKYSSLSVEEAEPYSNSGLYMIKPYKAQIAVEIMRIAETKMQITEVGIWIYKILNDEEEKL